MSSLVMSANAKKLQEEEIEVGLLLDQSLVFFACRLIELEVLCSVS